jgi:hypothetical protein
VEPLKLDSEKPKNRWSYRFCIKSKGLPSGAPREKGEVEKVKYLLRKCFSLQAQRASEENIF